MPLLELVSEQSEALHDMNDEYTWALVNTFRLLEPAPSRRYISELLATVPTLSSYWLGHAHGPYRLGALTADDYQWRSLADIEAKLGAWISGVFGPRHATDPEPILSKVIRPLLVDAELFLQTGEYDGYDERQGRNGPRDQESFQVAADEHRTLVPAADFLSWNEVVAVNRQTETLTMLILGSD